jgi:hypothetical protein
MKDSFIMAMTTLSPSKRLYQGKNETTVSNNNIFPYHYRPSHPGNLATALP